MTTFLSEDEIEEIGLEVLAELGYDILFGPDIGPESLTSERANYQVIFLKKWLRRALTDLNSVPASAVEEAIRELERFPSQNLIENNREFHEKIVKGIPVQVKNCRDEYEYRNLKVIDFNEPLNNIFHAVNQYTVIEGNVNKRPDTVLFVNGIPLVVIEYKKPSKEMQEGSTIDVAINQLDTYKSTIPSLFNYNAFLVACDGLQARAGTLNSGREWFLQWKTIDGVNLASPGIPEIEVLLQGMCNKHTLLDIIKHFIVFEDDGGKITKKLAAYHQYYAVKKAVEQTIQAARPEGDKKVGVIWHTQGSGKSLSMVFYTGKLVIEPDLENPTIVVLTDRNDLDEQLFNTFSRCNHLIRQAPIQAEDKEHLKKLLASTASGGIYFTTVQKFLPEKDQLSYPTLSDRKNIIFIADEAHRSHYGFAGGYAHYLREALPNASFIGFTGTPISLGDRNTVNIFGNYIDTYDIQRSVIDGNTVKIYYEHRVIPLEFPEDMKDDADTGFIEITADQEEKERENTKSRWSRLEALFRLEGRQARLAKNFVDHFEARDDELDGKAMIVCMSRRICAELYNEIIKLRPRWHHEDDDNGLIKAIISGNSSDEQLLQPHIRSKARRRFIAERFKDYEGKYKPLKIAIVRDMWLTGFDVKPLHTMYIDKPMKGHTLMQAIARVNRVLEDKEGGLIVDYASIGSDLKEALAHYSEGDQTTTGIDQDKAVQIMLTKFEIIQNLFSGFDYSQAFQGSKRQRLRVVMEAQNFLLGLEDGEKRYLQHSIELVKAYKLAVPRKEALAISQKVGFFKLIRAALINLRTTKTGKKTRTEIDQAIRQLITDTITSKDIIDIFALAGIEKPEFSILDEKFLQEIREMKTKNLAAEMLRKLIEDEIRIRRRRNLVLGKMFSEKLEQTIIKYHNRAITSTEVIEELISIAKEMKEASDRGEQLGLNEDELAFYDALETNDSAVAILGDKILKEIALELHRSIRNSITIDWTVRENIRAGMRVKVRRILRKYGYPPDKQEKATETVIEQAETLSEIWATN
ncbi:MAG: type I restriction endonuclease subunit R [Candidatus Bathyarchaeota archaeon]|nr:type I restriction endonuclease subunit R [Candidatus Bathyarchaeota archaeon]